MLVTLSFRKKSSVNYGLNWSSFWTNKSLFTLDNANCCHQHNITGLFHRHFCKYFHDKGIRFSLTKDFNVDGGFQVYWNDFSLLKNKTCLQFWRVSK